MANGIELLLQYVTLPAWLERCPQAHILDPSRGIFEFNARRFRVVNAHYCLRETGSKEPPDVWHAVDLLIHQHHENVPAALRDVSTHYGLPASRSIWAPTS